MSEEVIHLNFEDGKKHVEERLERWKREAEERQRAMPDPLDVYNDFCRRFAKQSNVASWLRKHRRTPEIVLLHNGHAVGMSISFYIPADDEPALLAWDLKPYQAQGLVDPDWRAGEKNLNRAGYTFLRVKHKAPFGLGGTIGGTSYFESGELPSSTTNRYAPRRVQIQCWCGASQGMPWSLVLKNIERTTRPGHTRIENKHIATTLPMS